MATKLYIRDDHLIIGDYNQEELALIEVINSNGIVRVDRLYIKDGEGFPVTIFRQPANNIVDENGDPIGDIDDYINTINNTPTGGVQEAPNDGQEYVRKNEAWAVASAAGGGDKTYTHVQGSPNTVWTIAHGLAKYPSVQSFDSTGELIYGDVEHIDINNLTITFSVSFGGNAYLN